MADNIVQTIIINRNDNLFTVDGKTGWDNGTIILMEGEIALAKITTKQPNGHGGIIEVPAYLMKVGVGDKNFNESAWLYAKASDVYSWAKKESLEYNDLPQALQTIIEELKETSDDIESRISSAIAIALNALDNDDVGEGSFVTAVTQSDGKVTVTYGNIEIEDIDGLQLILDGKADASSLTDEVTKREALGNRVSKNEGDISTLNGKVSTIEGTVSDINNTKADKADLDRTDASLAEVKSAVDNFFDDDAAVNDTIDTLKEIVNYIATDAASAADITARLGVLEGKVDVNKVSEAIATANQEVIDTASNQDTAILAEAQSYADTKDAELTTAVNTLETNLSTVSSKATTNASNISTLTTKVNTNARDIDALQAKHAYAHYVYIEYTNADNTKKAIFTTLLVTKTAKSYYQASYTQEEQLTALWNDLRALAGGDSGPHLMASGSFYGEPSNGAATRGYCISNIRNNLTDAGTKQIWLVGYNPDRGLSGQAGIALVSIDTDSTGTVTLRDFVYQLI